MHLSGRSLQRVTGDQAGDLIYMVRTRSRESTAIGQHDDYDVRGST